MEGAPRPYLRPSAAVSLLDRAAPIRGEPNIRATSPAPFYSSAFRRNYKQSGEMGPVQPFFKPLAAWRGSKIDLWSSLPDALSETSPFSSLSSGPSRSGDQLRTSR